MKTIFTKKFFIKFGTNFLVLIGIISGIIQIITFCYADLPSYGWKGWLWIMIISIIISLFRSWPRQKFSKSFSHPDVNIIVKIGDIFNQSGHIIIGFSDTFDTEIGDIISKDSLQGQFLSSIYNNNQQQLDNDLELSLQNEVAVDDQNKIRGKKKRYKIGTVATITKGVVKYFCCAYSYMGNNLKATSDINNLWVSLQKLWEKIRIDGEQKTIVMPVIGTNLSRVPGISFKLPISLILLSFIINSRVEPISKELILMIRKSDKDKVNLLEIQDFLKSLNN